MLLQYASTQGYIDSYFVKYPKIKEFLDQTVLDGANEKMVNYGEMDDSQKDTTNGKILKEVSGMSTDVATAYEDDNAYYILIKGDVKDRDTEYAKDNHEDLLKEMKSDEFQKKLTSWVEKLDIKVNNKAIKRYTPKVVYDKQTEYYSKNNNS